MRKGFAASATLLLLVVIAQFFFAASGAFSTAPHEESFRPHHVLGYVIFIVAVVTAVAAALDRRPWRLIGRPVLVAGLTGLQVVLAEVAKSLGETAGPFVFGLHGITGVAMLAVVWTTFRRAWASPAPTEPSAPAELTAAAG